MARLPDNPTARDLYEALRDDVNQLEAIAMAAEDSRMTSKPAALLLGKVVDTLRLHGIVLSHLNARVGS
jgi:hypothetical protein